jgi:alpha-glucosidase
VTNPDWWRDAVVYQIYPRSFADGNGDGLGDLPGATGRLEYLAGLGVDAIWLSPFYRSPMVDGGYDVADYRDVDPAFGTLADFDALVSRAHGLGIRVIVDLVPNHCSSLHPWFLAALEAGPGSPERSRFWFRPGRGSSGELPPNDWQSIFGGPAWSRAADGEWYLHLFAPEQPDFSWSSPAVRAEFLEILRFWLDRGVDGFRVDVAHGLVKADGLPDTGREADEFGLFGHDAVPYFDQDGVHEIYREWRPVLDSYGAMAVAEAWVSPPERLARYIGPSELHQAFNFDFMLADFDAVQLRKVIDGSLAEAAVVGAPTTWVLSNHDKPRHVTRYGSDGALKARAAALLMLALPGSAYLYNGEELGLDEVTDIPDSLRLDPAYLRTGESRDGCRVAIPWSLPLRSPQPSRWAALTADRQEADPGSMLNLYRTALALRRSYGLGRGSLEWLEAPAGVLAFGRGAVTVVVNTGTRPVPLREYGARTLLASQELPNDSMLPPHAAAWIHDRS